MAKASQPKGMPRSASAARISVWDSMSPKQQRSAASADRLDAARNAARNSAAAGRWIPQRPKAASKDVWESLTLKNQRTWASDELRAKQRGREARDAASVSNLMRTGGIPVPHNKLKKALEGVRKSRGKKYKPTGSGKWRTINGARVFIPD